jgi:2-C-methyl-D-erythritol 4-phosphate cytidylyltransferase
VRDTLKRVAGTGDEMSYVAQTVDRAGLWAAQTPQVFRATVLRAAFDAAGEAAAGFTDDASLVEAIGVNVAIFPGGAANLKLTLPEDIPVVEALLSRFTLPGLARRTGQRGQAPHPSAAASACQAHS